MSTIYKNKFAVILTIVELVVFVIWWFYIADWISKPRTYRGGIFYICAVVLTLGFHIRAFLRFNRMTKLLRLEEATGDTPPGSTIFAANQRFRYAARLVESCVVLLIGVLAIASVSNPTIQLNKNYFRLVITYFVFSILLTGYLTFRDLLVVDRVKKLAQSQEDVAALSVPTVKDGH